MRLLFSLTLATSLSLVLFGCFDPPLCLSPNHCEAGQACAIEADLEQGLPSDLIGVIGQCSDSCTRDNQCREGERCGDDATCEPAPIGACFTAEDCSLYGACVLLDNPLPFLPDGLCESECVSADECREGWACTQLSDFFDVSSCLPVCHADPDCREGEECRYGRCAPPTNL